MIYTVFTIALFQDTKKLIFGEQYRANGRDLNTAIDMMSICRDPHVYLSHSHMSELQSFHRCAHVTYFLQKEFCKVTH